MNVFQALNKTYIDAEKMGLVNQPITAEKPVKLLPLYHDSKRSTGFDVINFVFNENGSVFSVEFVPEDEIVVFPVRETSIGRSAGISPHPLVDKLSYLSPSFKPEHHERYIELLLEWKEWADLNDPVLMLDLVSDFIKDNDIYLEILEQLSKSFELEMGKNDVTLLWHDGSRSRSKKVKFADVFVTFGIRFTDSRIANETVTENKLLQASHIAYTEHLFSDEDLQQCYVSGELTYCVGKHPGLLGNAKIISVSNHKEVHFGRLLKTDDLFNLGFNTSQRIHLMLKYLLENPDNCMWLGGNRHLVNWFSNDIPNSSRFWPTNTIVPAFEDEPLESDERTAKAITTLGGLGSRGLGKHLKGLSKSKADYSMYYAMIIEKTSNGRIAIKYFTTMGQSDLEANVSYWYDTFSWPNYQPNIKKSQLVAPGLYYLVTTLYGEEDNARLEIKGERTTNLRASLIADLIPCVIERKPMPKALANKAFSNGIRRVSYKNTWNQQMRMILCVLTKHYKDIGRIDMEEKTYMLDQDNMNRSYLYGRLLAVYDRIESTAQFAGRGADDSQSGRSTNAQRLWTSFTATPSSTNLLLRNKVQVYLNQIRKSRPGSASFLERILQDVVLKLEDALKNVDNPNAPLDESFLFGYYGQNQAFYKGKKGEQLTREDVEVPEDVE